MNRRVFLLQKNLLKGFMLLCAVFCFLLPNTNFAQTPAIPKFAIQYWDVPGRIGSITVTDMNNLGQITGVYKDANDEDCPFFLPQ